MRGIQSNALSIPARSDSVSLMLQLNDKSIWL